MTPSLTEYVLKETDTASDLTEVMKRKKTAKALELENLQYDVQIAEERKKIQETSPNKVDSSQGTNFMAFLSSLFIGKSPTEIKDILTYLTQEQIDKLRYISESSTQNNLRGLMQTPNTGIKEVIEIVKLVNELQQPKSQGTNDMKGIAELIKAVVEVTKAQNPPSPPQPQQQQDPLTFFRGVQEIVKPYQDSAAQHQRELIELKLKEVENKNVDPFTVIKNLKTLNTELGLGGSNGKSEIDLRLEEMRQNKELETQKLDWEKQKYTLDKENEGNTFEQVTGLLNGPLGGIIGKLGEAGAEKLRGGSKTQNYGSQAQTQQWQSQLLKVTCPNCAGDFPANPKLATVQCPLCGVQLQNNNQASPAPETPRQTQQTFHEQSPLQKPETEQTQISSPIAQSLEIPQKEKPTNPIDQTVEVEPFVNGENKQ